MQKLQYSVEIDAPREHVWETMLGDETYRQWVDVAWPGSRFKGEWKQGTEISFHGGEGEGGTLAHLTIVEPFSRVQAEHVAVIGEDGAADRESVMAKDWIGTLEHYTFTDKDGGTELVVDITTSPDWVEMLDSGWPAALQALKQLSEKG